MAYYSQNYAGILGSAQNACNVKHYSAVLTTESTIVSLLHSMLYIRAIILLTLQFKLHYAFETITPQCFEKPSNVITPCLFTYLWLFSDGSCLKVKHTITVTVNTSKLLSWSIAE